MEKMGKAISITDLEAELSNVQPHPRLQDLLDDGWQVVSQVRSFGDTTTRYYLERKPVKEHVQRRNVWRPAWCM